MGAYRARIDDSNPLGKKNYVKSLVASLSGAAVFLSGMGQVESKRHSRDIDKPGAMASMVAQKAPDIPIATYKK